MSIYAIFEKIILKWNQHLRFHLSVSSAHKHGSSLFRHLGYQSLLASGHGRVGRVCAVFVLFLINLHRKVSSYAFLDCLSVVICVVQQYSTFHESQ